MSKSIFISRELSEDSPLLAYLQQEGWEIHTQSLIKVEPIPFELKLDTDWIFVSSKNGVRFLFEDHAPHQFSSKRIGVVGNATAQAVRSYGYEPSFIGNSGDMTKVGRRFRELLRDQTVRFFGAEGGSEKLRNTLQQDLVFFTPIYRTGLLAQVTLPETDVVFLTSPSNAKVYLSYGLLQGKEVIAIGNTTAEFLANHGIRNIHIPTAPSDEHVVAVLRKLG